MSMCSIVCLNSANDILIPKMKGTGELSIYILSFCN